MIFFVQLLAFHIVHGNFALGTLYKSTASCFGVTSPASNFMSSSCPPGEVIAIKTFTVAYKAAALNCTLDSVRIQNQFQLCCSNITEQDCQMSYNIHPNNAVQYIEKCNGRRSCNVMATVVLPQDCIGVPDHYPNYMHINYYCIPETGILSSMSGTITSTSLGQHVYLQSPGFNNGQKIPSGKTLTCSVHTCDMGSKLSITLRQIVMENKWGQCQQRLIVRRPDGIIIGIWNCQNNTASPKTLQTSEQYLIIQLENSLTSDLGSFWLGFAGSSPDGRVTVSCPPETNPCAGASSTIYSTSTAMTTTTKATRTMDSTSTPMTPTTTTTTTTRTTTDSTSTPMTTTTSAATTTDLTSTLLTTNTTATTTDSISTQMVTSSTTTTTTTTTATTSISTTAGQSSTSNITEENTTSIINVETLSNSKTTLGSTLLDTSTTPKHKKGLTNASIGIVVGGIVGFGLIAFILSIVFIRRRINNGKAHRTANPLPSYPRAVPIWNPNETTNPGYAPSSSSYEVFVRIAEGAS
ncbi:mucin-3A-like [Mya arenaria]|uniref:mucin-3A-like n=1 Tax=Mya arenaria TaxID=6604 RepID=UPI0022E9021F|nr:mucin-3A-like [Mya arenaria]